MPVPAGVSMQALLAAGVAATAVSTPPAREHVPVEEDEPEGPEGGAQGTGVEQAAPESEAA